MFRHRSNWLGYDPASAWFFVAGELSRPFDALSVSTPLIVQTRGVDTLATLRGAGSQARTFGGAIEELAAQPQAVILPEAWLAALRADAQGHSVSPESLRAILYAAWVGPRQASAPTTRIDPDSVTLPVDTVLPGYGDDPFRVSYASPQPMLSLAPYRATWLGSPPAVAAGTRAGRALGNALPSLFMAPLFPTMALVGRVLGRAA